MPVKLNWTRGKSLGLALIYLGIAGLLQIIFMFIGQYRMLIGSRPILILVPIGVILTTFYSVIILFESNTSMAQYRQAHKYKKKKRVKQSKKQQFIKFFSPLWKNPFIQPMFYMVLIFGGLFGLTYFVFFTIIEEISTLFVVADNVGAIGTVIFAAFMESSAGKKTR